MYSFVRGQPLHACLSQLQDLLPCDHPQTINRLKISIYREAVKPVVDLTATHLLGILAVYLQE